MNQPLQYPLGNTERYLNAGDRRLPESQLWSILGRTKHSTHGGADLIAADVCIDLAVWNPSESEALLAQADGWLSGVITDAVWLREEGYDTQIIEENAATASIRQWELPNWGNAIAGQSQNIDYAGVLKLSQTLLDLVSSNDHGANDRLREFVPLLLGARAEAGQAGEGWFGRMALSREDCRIILSPDKNPNWDVAIWNEESPDDFIAPLSRWQVKRARTKGSAKYEAAGVRVINAARVGMHAPRSIIAGCIQEAGLELSADVPSYEPGQLEDITARLRARLFIDEF